MLKIAICDDVKADRDTIYNLINEMCLNSDWDYDFEISVFACGEDIENYYEDGKQPFDIIFLDIYMTGKTGIEAARQIRKYDSLCKIIFTTTSAEHALAGYSVFAYNYLVKPITLQTLVPVLKKAVAETNIERKKVLCIKTGNKVEVIPYKNIKYIESQGKIIKISMANDDEITCYLKLDEIASMLVEPRFLRSHKSFLVNMDYVTSVEEYFFILDGGTNIPIRQKGFSSIKKKYYEFIMKKLG